ncbi:hypothetical protein ABPG77_001479 [Micractinium sp. CCAP 211/92]
MAGGDTCAVAGRHCAGGVASLSLIIGSQPNSPPSWDKAMMSLTVLNSSGPEPAPATYTTKGLSLSITGPGGAAATSAPDFAAPPQLAISSADGSLLLSMDGDGCRLFARFRGQNADGEDMEIVGSEADKPDVVLTAECVGPPVPWDSSGYGPESCAARLPTSVIGIHWFVFSLATPLKFCMELAGRPAVCGTALAHFEKNWGRTFPAGWHWAQGVNASGGHSIRGAPAGSQQPPSPPPMAPAAPRGMHAAFALAGGRLPSPLVPEKLLPDLWLLGVRTPSRSWDMHSGMDSVITAQADPCRASLLVSATQPLMRRAVDIQITARPSSFATLEGPTRSGFRPYLDESLGAFATVRLFELRIGPSARGWVQKVLVESFEVDGAALEFGGDRRCTDREDGGVRGGDSAATE